MQLILCEPNIGADAEMLSYSPFVLKVHAALRTLGLKYERRFGNPRDFRAINPKGQVPVLLVNGKPMAESTDILRFLFESVAAPGAQSSWPDAHEAWLWKDYADRALSKFLVAARWADSTNWPLARTAYFGDAPWLVGALIAPQIRRQILAGLVSADFTRAGLDNCWREYRKLLTALEARAPAQGFWLGTAVSPADCALYGHVGGLRTRLTAAQAMMVAEHPALSAYLDRIRARVHSQAA